MLSITADMIPGKADGSAILKIVRSFPAPSAKLPSRRLSETDFRLSSVERTIVGISMMLTVRDPAMILLEPPNTFTKVIMPNKP